ncbi:hypothetical protein ACFP3Q_13805 [Nocardioides sp. GCM10027113]|uniref:hypothetical protein n=1 Tax=unclassified Nocardioides TaxID=2615069 RepID=UPI0036241B46
MTAPTPSAPVDPDFVAARAASAANYDAWVEILDRLERDVVAHERLLHTGNVFAPFEPEPWIPPAVNGALPDSLLPRAQAIHQRQTKVKTELAKAMAAVRAKHRMADRAGRSGVAQAPATATYVDVSA